jgi:hypothetical protein
MTRVTYPTVEVAASTAPSTTFGATVFPVEVSRWRAPSRSKSSPKGDAVPKVKSRRVGGNELVLTPGGWRLKSKTFKLEPGQHVAVQEGKLRVIRTANWRSGR